ncbi:MAG: metallophosphoesterase, partial [Gemmatimonadota bacterium]
IHRGIAELAYSLHPDVVIRTGDNVDSGGTLSQWNYFFAIERPVLSSSFVLSAVGNHEYVGDAAASNYFDLLALPPGPAGTEQFYSFRYNNTLFVALDTELSPNDDPNDPNDQYTQLVNALDAANQPGSGILWKVVFFHRPAYSSGYHGADADVLAIRNAWAPIFSAAGVDVVLSGHDHDYEHLLADGVHYLVIGGAGTALRDFTRPALAQTIYRDGALYHLVVFDADDAELSVTPYAVDGSPVPDAFSLGAP